MKESNLLKFHGIWKSDKKEIENMKNEIKEERKKTEINFNERLNEINEEK
tara:strand:+ start:1357 stop:1506 length:150 start_codon:yes stop_codon:yes gene_type:complete